MNYNIVSDIAELRHYTKKKKIFYYYISLLADRTALMLLCTSFTAFIYAVYLYPVYFNSIFDTIYLPYTMLKI